MVSSLPNWQNTVNRSSKKIKRGNLSFTWHNEPMIKYEKENLGRMIVFLLPSLKLKKRGKHGLTLEDKLHDFLLRKFKGYTAAAGNIFGYWKNAKGREFYGEHKEYKVSLLDKKGIKVLEEFLVSLAQEMLEESVYVSAGDDSWLLYCPPKKKPK